MTGLAEAGPPAAPDLGQAVVASRSPESVPRLLAPIVHLLRPLFRPRRLDVGDLTDGQLADVGLTRADLLDRLGRQRWPGS